MTTIAFSQQLRVAACILVASWILAVGCRKDNGTTATAIVPDLLTVSQDSGLHLQLHVERDTVAAGSPIHVMYFLINGSTRINVWNNPDLFEFNVETLEGKEIPFVSSSSQTINWGPMATLVLPAHGILGQLIDLKCMGHQFVTSQDQKRCAAGYSLNKAGKYRVIGVYKRPKDGVYAGPELADTAGFVVK